MANFKCKKTDCGHEFSGNEYTDQCPKCGGYNIESTKSNDLTSTISSWFRANKIIAYGLSLFVLALILITTCDSEEKIESNYPQRYSLDVIVVENHFEINISYWTKKEGSYYKKGSQFLSSKKRDKLFYFEDKVGDRYTIRNNNQIYPCDNKEQLILMKPVLDKTEIKTGGDRKSLRIEKENTRFDCGPEKTKLTIEKVAKTKDCGMKVVTNLDKMEGVKVMISITGKEGKYENKTRFNAKDISKFDVWVYKLIGDMSYEKRGYHKNGYDFTPIGCPVDGTMLEGIRKAVEVAAVNYGKNPSSRKALRKLKSLLNQFVNIAISLDGKNIENGEEGMENMFPIKHEGEGVTFKVTKVKISAGGNYLKIGFSSI